MRSAECGVRNQGDLIRHFPFVFLQGYDPPVATVHSEFRTLHFAFFPFRTPLSEFRIFLGCRGSDTVKPSVAWEPFCKPM